MTSERSGICGAGNPPETGAMSPMVATAEKAGRTASAVPAASATAMANSFALVRPMRSTRATVTSPTASVAGSMRPAWATRSPALQHLVVVAAREAGEGAELAEDDLHGHAGHEADHDGVRDEAREAAAAEQPGGQHHEPGQDGEHDQTGHPVRGGQVGERGPDREAEGGGRHHGHALRAGGEGADRRARHGRVQPVHRRHAGHDGVGEREADLRDAQGEAGQQVVGEVGARREAQPRAARCRYAGQGLLLHSHRGSRPTRARRRRLKKPSPARCPSIRNLNREWQTASESESRSPAAPASSLAAAIRRARPGPLARAGHAGRACLRARARLT